MNFQNSFPVLQRRLVKNHPPVKASWPKQGGIENVRTVSRRDDDDCVTGVEAVHLNQNLVERLFALVMAAAQSGAAMPTNGVDFIHENNRGCVFLGEFEGIPDAVSAHADEHLDKFGAGDEIEGDAGLVG